MFDFPISVAPDPCKNLRRVGQPEVGDIQARKAWNCAGQAVGQRRRSAMRGILLERGGTVAISTCRNPPHGVQFNLTLKFAGAVIIGKGPR